ncbi:hypothetical protein F2Q70_00036714 [Brassica cretica]|uniref:Uncharacterized protein n=1 Tax=Brassica cretica TaxID=69181 RepID=A0A8S9JRK2_BRACR|nr:hypothetical protein F2Q70_00036714 [Brassica cretica]
MKKKKCNSLFSYVKLSRLHLRSSLISISEALSSPRQPLVISLLCRSLDLSLFSAASRSLSLRNASRALFLSDENPSRALSLPDENPSQVLSLPNEDPSLP